MKNIKIIILAIIISFFIGFYIIKKYKNIDKDITYGFVYGEYDKENFDKETLKLSNYIYRINNNKYTIYLGITRSEKNIEKIKGFLEKKGYSISVRDIKVDNEFKNFIDHCDKLLEKVNEDKMVEKIENEILEYGVI